MLIGLGDRADLELGVSQSCIDTEVPVCAFCQVPGLGCHGLWGLQLVAEVKAGVQTVRLNGHALLSPPGMGHEPAVLGLKELLLEEVLLV